MFELVQQPARSQIMRYGAWKRQNDAFLQMGSLGHRIRAGNLADITASHATAISLLGVAPPRSLDPRTHIVVKEWRNHRHINNVVCHYSKNADTLGATIVSVSGAHGNAAKPSGLSVKILIPRGKHTCGCGC